MSDIGSTLYHIGTARIDSMSKVEKAAWLRERGWRQVSRGKTPHWQAPSGGVIASSASVALRLQVTADEAVRDNEM
jgi:hypothetical protein